MKNLFSKKVIYTSTIILILLLVIYKYYGQNNTKQKSKTDSKKNRAGNINNITNINNINNKHIKDLLEINCDNNSDNNSDYDSDIDSDINIELCIQKSTNYIEKTGLINEENTNYFNKKYDFICFWDDACDNKELRELIKYLLDVKYFNCVVVLINDSNPDYKLDLRLPLSAHIESINNINDYYIKSRFILFSDNLLNHSLKSSHIKMVLLFVGINLGLPLIINENTLNHFQKMKDYLKTEKTNYVSRSQINSSNIDSLIKELYSIIKSI